MKHEERVGNDGEARTEALFRLDFVTDLECIDKEAGLYRIAMHPDPRRYEWIESGGERMLYDKLDQVHFPERVLRELPDLLEGMPVGWQPAGIAYAPAYVRSRRQRIPEDLARPKGAEDAAAPSDKSEEFLEALAERELEFAVLSIDMVRSTPLAARLQSGEFSRVVKAFLYETSRVVPQFHGHVLKYGGDGLIAYFPEPSFIIKNDLAVDCALTMHGLVYAALNPCLADAGLPGIEVKIGLDSGQASVTVLGSSKTRRHADIIGLVVGLACKIQGLASPGEIWMGETLERNLHVLWREICEGRPVPPDWPYKGLGGQPYKVFSVKPDALDRNVRSMRSPAFRASVSDRTGGGRSGRVIAV